jgi:hypothetical protein
MQPQENSRKLPWYQCRCWFIQGMRYRFSEKTADCKLSLKPLNALKAPHKPLEEMGSCCIFQYPMMWERSDAPAEMNRASHLHVYDLCVGFWIVVCFMLLTMWALGSFSYCPSV